MPKKNAGARVLELSLLLLAALVPQVKAASSLKVLARDLARPAREAGISRVAVLPFAPADQAPSGAGRIIAERLLTELVRTGGVAAVERALLEKLLVERGFAPGKTARVSGRLAAGQVQPVAGLVVGSFLRRGADVLVRARLIEFETGLVVAASERMVSRRWLDIPDNPQTYGPEAISEYCVGAEEEVDRLEGGILDLKARYWALQMRRGASLSALRDFPGANISDLELRQTLYDRMHDWYARSRIPELSPAELRRLLSLDRRAFLLHTGCRNQPGG